MEDSNTQQPVDIAPSTTRISKKSIRTKLAVPVLAGVVLLSGVGAAAFNAKLQNNPDKIWADALSNTAVGFESIINEVGDYDGEGLEIDGSFKLRSPLAAEGSVTGQWFKKNALLESSIGVSGVRIDSEVRVIGSDNSDTPDVYVYVDGIDAVQGFLGQTQPQVSSLIEQINGQWIVIDRTLIDQSLAQLKTETDIQADIIMLKQEDFDEISRVTAETINGYIFTDDESKAVFQVAKELGEDEFDGVDTFKYEVVVNKDNLKQFVTAYKDALKETQFDEYIASTSKNDETFEEVIKFDQILQTIDEIDFSQTKNEAWVDLDRRLIRNIRITPIEQDPGTIGYIEFALPYDGGDELPFTFRINTGKEEALGNEIVAEFVAGYNKVSYSFDLSFDIEGFMDEQPIDVTAQLNITPSIEQLDVEKPVGATNVLKIIGQLQGSLLTIELESEEFFNQYQLDDVEL